MVQLLERCPTGVPGFDRVVEGGFIRGSLILLAGAAGTGKSTFAARFLYEGARCCGEPGVYVSFAEPKDKFYAFMSNYNMLFDELEKKGLFKFMQLPTAISKEALSSFMEILFKTVMDMKAKRLVIDSITPITQALGPLETRAILHNALYNLAHIHGLTIIMIQDLPIGAQRIGYGVEEFIADTVIVLHLDYTRPGAYRRYLNILKMRGTWISEVSVEYSLISGIGFVVHPPLTLRNVFIDRNARIKTYVKGLDDLLGGIIKGSSTLILGGPGSGKTLLTLTIAAENALRERKVLYLSLDEPVSQLEETLKLLNYDPVQLIHNGLKLVYMSPYEITPGRLRWTLRELIIERGWGSDLVVIDGLSALLRLFGEQEFVRIIEEVAMMLKNENIPVIFNLATTPSSRSIVLDTLVDNVVLLSINIEEDHIIRKIMVSKSRMNVVSNKWFRIELDENNRPIIV